MLTDLTARHWSAVDAHILAGHRLLAIKAIREFAGISLREAIEVQSERESKLRAEMPERFAPPPTRESLLALADTLPARPVAIEALWDGDTTGWFVRLAAVLPAGTGHRSHHLAVLRDGGDIRLFNGQVPPWPEARLAATVGGELAGMFGVPFYFPSPDHPEDDCPTWVDQDRGYACRRCGILLLQSDPCPWRGACYHCHLAEEREARHAGEQDV